MQAEQRKSPQRWRTPARIGLSLDKADGRHCGPARCTQGRNDDAAGQKREKASGDGKRFYPWAPRRGRDRSGGRRESGFEGPVSLRRVRAIYGLDAPLKSMFDPNPKGKGAISTAFAVKAP